MPSRPTSSRRRDSGAGAICAPRRNSPARSCSAPASARIVEFARVFRNRERGALHAPGIHHARMVPGAGEPYEVLMEDCAALLARRPPQRRARSGFRFAAARSIPLRRRSGSPSPRPSRATPASICMASLPPQGPDRQRFAAAAAQAGIRLADDDTWGDIFSRVLVEKIEPHLGLGRATILYEYPGRACRPLARPKPSDPRVAERFELYACGVELANGFGELTDPVEQRRAARRGNGGEGAHLRRALSDRRGFSCRARRDAAGLRRRARPRPAGDAGDRRAAHRSGDVDAGAPNHE